MYFAHLLGEKEINSKFKVTYREAVRGLVLGSNGTALIIQTNKGDYKLPGGGIEPGESHLGALKREIMEESGFLINDYIKPIGIVTEQRKDSFEDEAYFVMNSYYYLCSLKTQDACELELYLYEKALDFNAVQIPLLTVYAVNKSLLDKEDANSWLYRETAVLKSIINGLSRILITGTPYHYIGAVM